MTPRCYFQNMPNLGPNRFWFTPDQHLGFQHFRYDRPFVYPSRIQDEYAIVLCLAGEITVSEGNGFQRLLPGEVLVGNSRLWRKSLYGKSTHCEGLTLVASRRSVQGLLAELGDDRFRDGVVPLFPGKRSCAGLMRVAEDVLADLAGNETGRSQMLEALGREMLVRSLRGWPGMDAYQSEVSGRLLTRRHFVKALDYMQSRGKNEFSIPDMCGHVGLSAAEFTRLFARSTLSTPFATYNSLLIDRAQAMLEKGAASVKEVAHSLGFDSASQFTALFRKVTGASPSQVRHNIDKFSAKRHEFACF